FSFVSPFYNSFPAMNKPVLTCIYSVMRYFYHGMVQLGSNISRASMTLRHINLRLILWFAPGALLGAWLGSLFLVELPRALVQLCIAAFILLLCWGPPIPRIATSAVGTLVAAAITTFISLFVGATGPLVAAFVKQQ